MLKIIKYARMILFSRVILATSQITGQLLEKYVGCFVDIGNNQKLEPVLANQNDLTIEICIQKCYNETNQTKSEMTFAALNNGRQCICRNNSGQQLHDRNCNVKCSGDPLQVCGGNTTNKFYSLYTVCPVGYFGPKCGQLCHCKRDLPCDRKTGICTDGCDKKWTGTTCNISHIQKQYIGCYGDGPVNERKQTMDELNPGGKTGVNNKDTNSIAYCTEICSTNNYTYAGMQYGYDCNCGEKYNRYGNKTFRGEQVNCSFSCPANRNQKCGGIFANSVYHVCPLGFYGRNCVNRCHCNGDPCRFNGSCLSSTLSPCKPGWTGSACNIRVNDILWCSSDKDCTSNEACNVIDLNYMNVSRCRCKQGFHRMSIWDLCTDVDECQSDNSTCNPSSENCVNTIGSYRCECKDGFINISGNCVDIDECRNDSLLCDAETELCKNTFGSYLCHCKHGYKTTTFGNCTDVDECQSGNSTCIPLSENCVNIIGSFRCECKDGFEYIAGKCEDVDDCRNGPLVCDAETEFCKNTVGNYTCHCKPGYENTTFGNCTDVDECQLDCTASPCNANSERCINIIGSYMCNCKEGFTYMFGKCVEFNSTTTIGIILGTLLAISLLINVVLIISRINGAKSIKPEPGEDMAQSDLETSSIKILDDHEINYDEIQNRASQISMYEQIITGQRQLVVHSASEYAELRQIGYVNVASSN